MEVVPKTKLPIKRAFFQYSGEALQAAIDAVKQGMPKKKASTLFGVPRATIVRKAKGDCKMNFERKMGPQPVLSKDEEETIKNWILAMSRKGFPVQRVNLQDTIQRMVSEQGRVTPFTDNRPGRKWIQNFLRRHPELKEKHAECLVKARTANTKNDILQWFNEIKTYLEQCGQLKIMQDPSRVFNCDETGFLVCPKTEKVLGPSQSQEDINEEVQSDENQQITIVAMFSADGKTVPPMIIYPYNKIPSNVSHSIPANFGLSRSDSGRMTSEVFHEYVANHFLAYLHSTNVTRPVIVFVDGHRLHLTKQVSEFCDTNGIILAALPPNTTQPADISVFQALKTGWNEEVKKCINDNQPEEITLSTFGSLIAKLFEEHAKESSIKSGFWTCGLYPFSPESVDFSKHIKSKEIAPAILECQQTVPEFNLLRLLEQYIKDSLGEDQLQRFESVFRNQDEWDGDIESSHLFLIWNNIKCDVELDRSQSNTFPEQHIAFTTNGPDNIAIHGGANLKRLRTDNSSLLCMDSNLNNVVNFKQDEYYLSGPDEHHT